MVRQDDKKTAEKREREKKTVTLMMHIYCRGKHAATPRGTLCPSCQSLLDYALERLEGCPRMAGKTFCSVCPIHCYSPERREEIRQAMRYAGPRMLFYHPLLTLHHMFLQFRYRHNP